MIEKGSKLPIANDGSRGHQSMNTVHRQLCMDKVDKQCPMQAGKQCTAVIRHVYVSEYQLESSMNPMKPNNSQVDPASH